MNKKTKNLISKIEDEIRKASIRFELLLNIWGTQENLNTLNQVAGNVFLQFHNSLLETVVNGIIRLCDPAQDIAGNKNLTLERLRLSIPQKNPKNKVLYEQLLGFEKKIKKEVKRLKIFRNKRLAHNDLLTHVRNCYRTIPNSEIDQSLKMMEEFVSIIYLHFDNCGVHILNPIYPYGDGPNRLMDHLKISLSSNRIRAKGLGLYKKARTIE